MKPMWSGLISFGLVNIPVKLYSATQEQAFDLDMLHKDDFSHIRYAKMCELEEKEVPYEEVVKGFEYESGHYVVLTDEDFKKANVEKTKSISVINFVKNKDVDFMYYDKPYFLEPDGSDKAYLLFLETLKKTDRSALVRYVFRNREHLGLITPKENILVLEQLRYSSEIRDHRELVLPKKEKITEKEMQMAKGLVDQMTEKVNIESYEDTYEKELERIIEEKKKGKTPTAKGKIPVATKVPDLMEVLRKSLAQEKRQREKARTK